MSVVVNNRYITTACLNAGDEDILGIHQLLQAAKQPIGVVDGSCSQFDDAMLTGVL